MFKYKLPTLTKLAKIFASLSLISIAVTAESEQMLTNAQFSVSTSYSGYAYSKMIDPD